jgi:hypothetical protein
MLPTNLYIVAGSTTLLRRVRPLLHAAHGHGGGAYRGCVGTPLRLWDLRILFP